MTTRALTELPKGLVSREAIRRRHQEEKEEEENRHQLLTLLDSEIQDIENPIYPCRYALGSSRSAFQCL